MKKAKIMLIFIAVLAIVGGALAFKAKNNTLTFLCYKPPTGLDDGLCSAAIQATITDGTPDFEAFYSTEIVPEGVNVDPNVFCITIHCEFGTRWFKIDI